MTITRITIKTHQRSDSVAHRFGLHFPLKLEPTIYSIADHLAIAYCGGYWHFHQLSNGGFYMAPESKTSFYVSCDNGYEGELSPDALGIVACLYAYSHLSFGDGLFADTCAQHYHWLRKYALEHAEVGPILASID